jgi:hypothetical protein
MLPNWSCPDGLFWQRQPAADMAETLRLADFRAARSGTPNPDYTPLDVDGHDPT